jgi:predicted esterase
MLHGAGGDPPGGLDPLIRLADDNGLLLVAPASSGPTWDVIRGSYGPDVGSIDQALQRIFAEYRVDPARLAIGGFSDGASYALSVGLDNGDLFTHVIAFSPGFEASSDHHGRPRVFITHGRQDPILPLRSTSGKTRAQAVRRRLRRDLRRVRRRPHGSGRSGPGGGGVAPRRLWRACGAAGQG